MLAKNKVVVNEHVIISSSKGGGRDRQKMKNKLKKTLTNLWSGELATVLAVFLLLFALVEWINYFEWRLSYSYNPAVVIRYTLQRKLKRSKIAKEIEQSGKVCML